LTDIPESKKPSEAARAYMALLTNELVGMAQMVREEGGIRKLLLRFPNEQSVSIVLMRQTDLERSDLLAHQGKGRHPYQEQMEIKPVCAWCGAERGHPVHT
jgi:hypothetical protein